MERCFLFSKDNERVKEFVKIAKKSDSDHEKIKEKTAEIFGIENNEFTVCTTNFASPVINENIAKEKGFIDKLNVLCSENFEIKDKDNNHLGYWCLIKQDSKEFIEINKFIETLDLYKNECGTIITPSVSEIVIGRKVYAKGKCYIDMDYGIFFILDEEENDFESEKFKEAFKDAIEYTLSDFYKIKEETENRN